MPRKYFFSAAPIFSLLVLRRVRFFTWLFYASDISGVGVGGI